VPEGLDLGGAPADVRGHLGGRVQGDAHQGAKACPNSVERIAEHGAGCSTERHPPDQRVDEGRSGFACVGRDRPPSDHRRIIIGRADLVRSA
jgi:hypothetical protein